MAELKYGTSPTAPTLPVLIDLFTLPQAWVVVLVRLAGALQRAGLWPLAHIVRALTNTLFGADVDPATRIGPGLTLPHPHGVTIRDVEVGRRARLMGSVRLGGPTVDDPSRRSLARVGDDCWFMEGAKVLGDAELGDRCVVAATAVIHGGTVPDGAVVMGDPGRVIRKRPQEAT